MKTVLLVMPELYYGGAETQFRHLIHHIDKEKFRLIVAIEHSFVSHNKQTDSEFIAAHKDVKFYELKGLTCVKNKFYRGISTLALMYYLKKIIRAENPDVIFFYSYLSIKNIPMCKKMGPKIIYSERNSGENLNNPDFYRKCIDKFKKTDCIVCNSDYANEIYLKHSLNSCVIYNGVALPTLMLKKENHECFHVLVPARIAPVKNQKVVLNALTELRDMPIKISFIGKIEDKAYYDELKSFIDNNDLSDKVEFLEFTKNMAEMYQGCSLTLLPSVAEGFSNIILESYSYGSLCLASNIPMNTAIIKDPEFLFISNDGKDLARQLRNLYALPLEKANKIRQSNYDFIKNNFSIEKMVHEYEKLYEKFPGE